MLLIKARVRPCTARDLPRSSDLRVTTTCLAASSNFDGDLAAEWLHSSLPSGPSTAISPAATATFTPAGTGTGFLPMRDMFLQFGFIRSMFDSRAHQLDLPNFAQHFAAEVSLPRFAVADHAAAGADDRNSQAVEHRPQLRRRRLYTRRPGLLTR